MVSGDYTNKVGSKKQGATQKAITESDFPEGTEKTNITATKGRQFGGLKKAKE